MLKQTRNKVKNIEQKKFNSRTDADIRKPQIFSKIFVKYINATTMDN